MNERGATVGRHGGFFDRRDEQAHFEELVADGPARVLTIRDGSGRGKSQLLRRLRDRCKYADPPLPVALVPIKELSEKTPFQLVKRIDKELGGNVELWRFNELSAARLRRDPVPFAGRSEFGMVNASRAEIKDDAQVAGQIFNVQAEHATVVPTPWTDELDEVALQKCVAGFIEDLLELSDGSLVVLLIDSYEGCNDELREWLEELVNRCVFTAPRESSMLVMVFAGQDVPAEKFEFMLGERWSEVVRAIPSLSKWERGDVRDFLEYEGVDPTDEEVDFLESRLAKGMTIERAKRFVREYLLEERLDEENGGEP